MFNVALSFNLFWNTKILSKQKPKFNGVYSRNNLSKIKDGAYVINFDEFESTLYVNSENVTYFDSWIYWVIWSDMNIYGVE